MVRGYGRTRVSLRVVAAVGTALAVVFTSAPPPALGAGNAGIHLSKTVDPAQTTVNPALGLSLGVDKASAIPGDTLTYTAVVTNADSIFGMGGTFRAEALSNVDGTVVYYWDELQACAQGCGNGTDAGNPHWIAFAGFVNGQPGYKPVMTPDVATGLSLTATSVPANGVTYPTSGDPILGTVIQPQSTATWNYQSTLIATPSQIAFLSDPTKVLALRNVVHFEVTTRNSSAAEPYIDAEPFTNPFKSKANVGSLTNVTVTFTFPDGTTKTVDSSTVPGLALLAPGGAVTVIVTFKIPAIAAKAAGETDAAYLARLGALEGSALNATATATGTGFSGTRTATAPKVTTALHLPIVTIIKSGPTELTAGNDEVNPLALQNIGGATASGLTITDSLPGGATGTVTPVVPTSLAVGQAGSAQATFTVPVTQTPGDLTDTAAVTWHDANGNTYGPVSSSFTTNVKSSLANARLTLAPATAGPNPLGTSQTLTATLLDANGQPIAGKAVTFNVTGANPGTGSATTDAGGHAVFTYVGANAGNDVAQATVTAPGVTLNSNTASISWGNVLQPIVTGPVQGNFYPNPNNSCSFDVGPGSTPAFGQTFPDILFNAPASAVPHDISTVNVNTRPFTDLTVDVNGNYNGQIVAQGNGVQAGMPPTMLSFYAAFTGNFIVKQAGDVTFTILHDDGYIFGVGNGAARVNGDLLIDPAITTTPFNGYPVMAAWNTSVNVALATGTDTVHFPAPGTYPYELDYTECGGGALYLALLTAKFIPQTDPLSIYVGYADGLRPGGSIFPFPWEGSPGVSFVGGGTFDAGAIRFDNSGDTAITLDKVTVDIGGNHLDIWQPNLVVPAHAILIVTQTFSYNFDTSDFAGCNLNNGVLPVVNVTRGGVTTAITDTNQVLNTHGFDSACLGNESISWTRIAGQVNTLNTPLPPGASLNISPFSVPNALIGQFQALTVSAMDSVGNPVPNLPVTLQVFGPNAQTLTATTLANGLAVFGYVGTSAGTDSIQASAFISGLREISNIATVVWTSPGGANAPPPPSITAPSPADGTVVTKPTAITASISPPAGQTISSWTVFYQAASGGQPVQLANGTGAPPAQLATFDPTLLTNGSYTIIITATASGGGIQTLQSAVVVLGGLKIGRYSTTYQDLALPVTGIQMEVRRSYDSLDTATSGDFGFGWRVSISNFRVASNRTLGAGGWSQYNQSCVFGLCLTAFKNSSPRFVTVVYPDGRTEIFDFNPAGGTNIFWGCSPVFTARASVGTTSTLVALDDTACSYTGDGNIYGSNGPYNPQRFQLTTRDGRVIVLDHTLGLVSITDRNGNRLTVDANGVHASNGQGILYTRDGSGRITQVTGPAAGQTVAYTYSSAGDLATSTDPIGNVNTYTYDSAHHLLKVSGAQGALTTETYDASGRLTAVTDALGHTTQVQNNVGAQTVVFTDPLSAVTTLMTMDDLGDVVREDISSGGQMLTIAFEYDSVGHVTKKTDALGHSVTAAYDAQGELTRFTDALGNPTQFTYDANGQITSVIAPDGGTLSSATYDANGNPITILGPGGAVVHFTYSSSGLPLTRTDAAGNTIAYTYDSAGRLSGLTNAAGKTTSFQYDAANRPILMTDPLGNTVQFRYDGAGNVLGITDGRGNGQAFTYNSFGSVTSTTDPLGGTANVTYDADGRVTGATDRAGNSTTYAYDGDGRLTRINYAGGEFLATTYDGFGRPTTLTNSASSIDSSYDAAGQVVTTTTHAPSLGSVTLSYTYDAAGDRLTSTGPDGTASYAYDSRGRVMKVTDPRGGVFGLQYDSSSRITTLTRPNGITDSYAYDANGRLVGIASKLGPTTIQNLTQTLDSNGQVASTTDAAGTTTYTHDANGRLVAVSGPGASQAYAYDAAGNRTSGPLSTSSTYNAADELTSDTGFMYTYDAEGQRTSKIDRVSGATTHYTYNGAKKLTSIQYPDGTTTSYTYDPVGRRLTVSAGLTTTAYVYDGVNARLEYGSGALVASYVGAGEVDRPLEMTRGANSYYYLQNFQGSVTGLTDAGGAVAASYSYDAFGVPTSPAPAVTNPFTFTGREFDAKSGLYYNRARYYEPSTGSFTSQDPLASGQRYAYAGGDPVDFTDPSGAFFAEIAALYTKATAEANRMKLIGCGLALVTALVEVYINVAARQKLNWASYVAMGAGVVTACAFGYLGRGATSFRNLIGLPFASAVVAVLVDLALEVYCSLRAGNFDGLHPQHVIALGFAAFAIGAGAAIPAAYVPETATLGTKFQAALAIAIVSGEAAGLSDLALGGGACG